MTLTAASAQEMGHRAPISTAAASGPDTGAVPSSLVGTWRISAATGSQQCDDQGHCTGAYGGSDSYTFTAAGQFEYAQYLASNLGGCQQATFLEVIGSVKATPTSVTLLPTSAHNRKTDTCGASTDDDLVIDPTTYDWRLDQADDGRPQFYLWNAAGSSGPRDPA